MQHKPWYCLLFLLACAFRTAAQTDELPYSTIPLQTMQGFLATGSNWQLAGDVYYDVNKAGKPSLGKGTGILVNLPTAKANDPISTSLQHGDLALEIDVMLEKDAKALLLLQGRYGLQLVDSWGTKTPTVSDGGAIEERWNEQGTAGQQGYEGHAPAQNVNRAPGLWQHYSIVFRAPRFDAQGRKTANARFVSVKLNGVTIHENIELTGPTHSAVAQDEKATAPLVIKGQQGSLAVRDIRYKAYGTEPVTLSNLKLQTYEGNFRSFADLNAQTPRREMVIDLLAHRGTGSLDKFGGKITGTIHLPTSGTYLLKLNLSWIPAETNPERPNGAGMLTIDGKKLLDITGKNGGTAVLTTQLQAGDYPVELTYYKTYKLWYAKGDDISLSVEGPGVQYTTLNEVIRAEEPVGQIRLRADNETTMQRGFMNHNGKKHTHTIAVGEPGRASYSLDLQKGELLAIWRGDFLETTPMWHGRGETQLAVPRGSVIELPGKPSLAVLANEQAAWPDSNATYNNMGYDIDKAGRPVFKSMLGTASVRESITTADEGRKLTHTFTVTPGVATPGTDSPNEIWCRVAAGNDITQLPNGLYAVNGKQYFVELADKEKPVIRTTATNTKELLLPVSAKKGNVVSYSFIW
ncbi:family 16 glycoside hydrolase [Spirosoma sp. KUDC1026]|uniref:family 16 glycoside hydrolase n=1 Tax=Spirosoma sp. KUDC1026 TaxID=2745947 RepID=UPI00159BAA9E|nr:family 16 glycoside hydrolase [Spirosoma sp. KUDC1026]QKZ11306.1 DUF1080 domain-containing protein [Spirosoma sp. KUDC1026]